MKRPAPKDPKKGHGALDKYADTDDREFFGQASTAYFGNGQFGENRAFLKILTDIYHPAGGSKP